MPPAAEWAAGEGRAALVAETGRNDARQASEHAAAGRARDIDAAHGPGAAAAYREVADMKRQLSKVVDRALAAAERADKRAQEVEAAFFALRDGSERGADGAAPEAGGRRGTRSRTGATRSGRRGRQADGTSSPDAASDTQPSTPRNMPPDAAFPSGRHAPTVGGGSIDVPPDGLDEAFDPTVDPDIDRGDYGTDEPRTRSAS